MNCLEMVPTNPEQILNRTVDRKESLIQSRIQNFPIKHTGPAVRSA